MKYCFAFVFFICGITAFSQQSRYEYIRKYQDLAIKEMRRSGIPASITMAQACLESSDGNSELARKSNNHFGIKCKLDWRGDRIYYDDDLRNECFRSYNSVEESYFDHTNFLANNFRYRFLFNLKSTDYVNWAKGLKKAGYATAGHYANSLIDIIEKYKLYRLDQNVPFEELTVFNPGNVGNKNVSSTLVINPYRAHQVRITNNLKSVVARKGDTYDIIAKEFGLVSWEICNFNDQPSGYTPQENEVVYIENKNRKTPKNILAHRVSEGETMHYISQMYGIQLRPLLKRNRMKAGEQPAPGQVIQLRKKLKRN